MHYLSERRHTEETVGDWNLRDAPPRNGKTRRPFRALFYCAQRRCRAENRYYRPDPRRAMESTMEHPAFIGARLGLTRVNTPAAQSGTWERSPSAATSTCACCWCTGRVF